MRRSIMLALAAGSALLVLGTKPLNLATLHGDEARSRAESAISNVSSIRTAIADCANDVASLGSLVEDERQNRLRIARYLDTSIAEAQTLATTAQNDVASRRLEAEKAAASRRNAATTLTHKIRGIDDAILTERQGFEASASYVRSVRLVEALSGALTALTARVDAEIDANPVVAKAQKEANEAELVVKQARNVPLNDMALATASQEWIEATNRLNKARRTLLESNQSYQQSTDELRESQRALTVLKAQFEAALPTLPSVVAAIHAREVAEQALRVAEGEDIDRRAVLQRSVDALAKVQKDVELLSVMKRDPDASLRKFEASLDGVRSDLDKADSATSSAASDLAASLSAIRSLESELDHAASEITRLERELAEAKGNAK